MEQLERNIKFAWLPTRMNDGKWIWLKRYVEISKIIYPTIDNTNNGYYIFPMFSTKIVLERRKL
jgi:hypothetical protein